MNVIFDHQAFVAQKYGGVSRYAVELAKALASIGEISISVFGGIYQNQYLAVAKREVAVHGINFDGKLRGRRTISNLYWMLWRCRRGADVYHATYYDLLETPKRARRVVMVHDLADEVIKAPVERDGRLIQKKRSAISRADLIFCNSEYTRRTLCEYYGVPLERTRVTHLGISPTFGFEDSIRGRDRVILFVGNRRGYKNYRELRGAYERSPQLYQNFRLVCFGGEQWTRDDVPRAGIAENVRGSDCELAQWYQRATVLVYPSLYEGFGIPVLEALASECPVIAACRTSIPEIGGTHVDYFEPNSDALAEILIRRVQSARDMGRARSARDWALSFTWRACAAKTLAGYRDILA